MELRPDEITGILKSKIKAFESKIQLTDTGTVITVDIPSTLKLCVTVVKKDNSSKSNDTCIVRDLWTTKNSFNVTEDGYLHLVWAKQTDTQAISVSDWGGTYTYQA